MRASEPGSPIRLVSVTLWGLLAVYSVFSIPALWSELSRTAVYLSSSPEVREQWRTYGWNDVLEEIEASVPADEAILLDVPQVLTNLHIDRQLNYWLYPRRVYSAHALRMGGESVSEFTERHDIRWVVGDHRLERTSGEAVGDSSGAGTPQGRPVGLPGPIRAAWGVAVGLFFFLGVGTCILSASGISGALSGVSERVAASFLVGVAGAAAWVLCWFLAGFGVNRVTVLSSGVAALAWFLGGWSKRRRSRQSDSSDARHIGLVGSSGDRIALVACMVLAGLMVFKAAAEPMFGTDDRFQWAFKAKVMLHEESPRGAGFGDPNTLHFHPKYPLLVPAAEAVLFLFAGGFDDQYAKVLFPLVLSAGLVVFIAGLRSLGHERGAATIALLILLVPYYCGHGLPRDFGSGFTSYPDLILSVFVLAAMAYWVRGLRFGSVRLGALSAGFVLAAGLTKAEGKVHALIFLILVMVSLLWHRTGRTFLRRVVTGFVVVAVLMVLHELAFTRQVPTGVLPDDYGALLTWERFWANSDRFPAVLAVLVRDFFMTPRMGFVGLVLAWACIVNRGGLKRIEMAVPFLYVFLMLLAFCIPYVVGPGSWRILYGWAGARLISQVLPLAFWVFGGLLLAREERVVQEP